MVFYPPAWVPKLPFNPPDSIPLNEFMFNEQYGRHPLSKSNPSFTCGITGAEYSALEVHDRLDNLARALSKELSWKVNEGTEWDKVAGIFSVNTVSSTNEEEGWLRGVPVMLSACTDTNTTTRSIR